MVDTVASQPHFVPFIIDLLSSIENKDEIRLVLPVIIIYPFSPSPACYSLHLHLFALTPPSLVSSTLSVSTYYQLCQWLSTQDVSMVHAHILHYLTLLEAAARHDVNPEVSNMHACTYGNVCI